MVESPRTASHPTSVWQGISRLWPIDIDSAMIEKYKTILWYHYKQW